MSGRPRVSPGRVAAVRTLIELERRGGRLEERLAAAGRDLRGAERRLAWALALGVERRRRLLDHRLAPHLTRPPHKLDAPVRASLRSAAMELLYLDRIPARATVHQAVELARVLGVGRASGLINAALRSLSRDPDRAGVPDDPAVAHSLPRWILQRLPDEAAAAINEEPALALRPRRADLLARLVEAGVPAREGPAGAVLTDAGDPTALPGWDDGWFAVQDAAAQAVVQLVAARPGDRVLDACAAPGGKALALADAVGEGGSVVAVDRSAERLQQMEAERARLGITGRIEARVADVREGLEGSYDAVLVDAPCSALGTLRRHPEIRWQRAQADLPRHAETQAALLAGAAPAVRPGGTLVYAVCTFTEEEGPAVARSFLEHHPAFHRVPIDSSWDSARTADGDLATGPHQAEWDAFYAVVFRREA